MYEKIVSEKIAMALILEDDAKLSENIKICYYKIEDTIKTITLSYDIINLAYGFWLYEIKK